MSHDDHSTPVEYRQIPECDGYRFGSDGTVWSCMRRGYGRQITDTWHQIKAVEVKCTDKYTRTKVTVFYRGKVRQLRVARLILEAFVGPCPEGMESCHNDGNPLNNRLSNLRWDTRLNNASDKKRHGTENSGERHPMSRFTDDDIREIRRLRQAGLTHVKIAEKYHTDAAYICNICKGKYWKHLI